MNFRKLLAFVLVFSLAAQPGGVRFSYAEDTKAAEVKIEKKTEVSDELAIELDETELDEYLFDPGSREQKLEEAATVAAEETAKTGKISGALAGAIAAGVAAVTAAVGAAGLMIYNGANNASEIKTLWTSDEGTLLSRIGKTISILFKGAKTVGEHSTEPSSDNNEQTVEQPSEKQEKAQPNEDSEQSTGSDDGSGDVEVGGDVQQQVVEEQKIEQEGSDSNKEETKPTGIISKDKALCDEGKLDEEYCEKLEEKLQAKGPTEAPVEEQTSVVEGPTEAPVEEPSPVAEEKTEVNEGSNSREENSTTIVAEEKKEPFTHTFTAQPYYQYEKKHVQKEIDEIKNTCGLNTTNLQGQLNSINLEDVETIEELRRAEESIIKFGEKITSLLNSCKTINSNKGYIENNIQAVVNILDKSDVSLDHDWDELKNKPVTEGNVGELAEGYTTIAGRVKAIIESNKAIPKLTDKTSKVIEDNKNAEWFDTTFYENWKKRTENVPKTEESLPGIKNEVEELAKKLNGVETANKLDGEINELISGFDNYKTSYKTQYGAKYQVKCAELKKEHDLSKVVNELETFKKDLEARLNNLKTFCENRPEKCGKK